MRTRDEIEAVLRSWDTHERERGAPAVIDFDCHPDGGGPPAALDRLTVLQRLLDLHRRADPDLADRIGSHVAYLRALMGERLPLDEYIQATLGCDSSGWSSDYVSSIGQAVRGRIEDLGVAWGPSTMQQLAAAEGPMDADAAPDAIRHAARELEPAVRQLVDTDASFELTIEPTVTQAYWAYWLDGSGQQVRLRLNLRNASFTKVTVRQFALHEILGHGLQSASYTAISAKEDVSWVRLMSVHASHQILFEGLAQTLPLFATPDDEAVITRVKLEHYTYLVRAELHLAINTGSSVEECAEHAKRRIPWWTDGVIGDVLADRSTDPLLRSYLWAYPAGQDWFTHLSATDPEVWRPILRAAYRAPLTTNDLRALWPDGPLIGSERTQVQ